MITIKQASISDLKDIQELNHQLCIKEATEFDSTINQDFSITSAGEEYFKERITGEDSIVFLAKESNKIVGYMIGAMVEIQDYRTIKSLAEAENMFILEKYRGKGIGSQLLNSFVEWSKSKGAIRIKAITSFQRGLSLR